MAVTRSESELPSHYARASKMGGALAALARVLLIMLIPAFVYGQTIAVSPPQGPAGQPVLVNGTGWLDARDRQNGVDIMGVAGLLARARPDAGGNFTATITIPRSSPPGPVQIGALGTVDALASYIAGSPRVPSPCVGAYFIGVHGIQEGPDPNSSALPNAPELMETWNTFALEASIKNPAKTVDYSLLPYHAPDFQEIPSNITDLINLELDYYNNYVAQGVSELIDLTNKILANCPTQRFVFVGYSFGAWVIDRWLSGIDINSQIWNQILAVQLYGDPLWYRTGQNGTYEGIARRGLQTVTPDPYTNSPQGPGGSISNGWESLCLQKDPICGEGYASDLSGLTQQLIDAKTCPENGCEHLKYTKENYIEAHPEYLTYDITTRGANFLVSKAFPSVTGSGSPEIVQVGTFREGDLVFFRLLYSDPDGDAAGFGFRGVNGAGWAQETHPFSSPSYGRVSPGEIDYPFNLLCDTGPQYESDVQGWIYDSAGRNSPSVIVHLACAAPSTVAPIQPPSEGTTPFPWFTLGGIAR